MRRRLLPAALALTLTGCVHRVSEQQLLVGPRLPYDAATAARPDLEVAVPGAVLRGTAVLTPGSRMAVVYFGGNAQIVGPDAAVARLAARHRFDLYGVNYRGYGPSEGTPSLRVIAEDALAVFDHVAGRPEVSGKKLLVWGYSLGTLPALAVAVERPVAGVILQGSPTSARDAVPRFRRGIPWPQRALVRLRATPELADARPQPIDLAPRVRAPLLSLHGTRDEVVSIRLGRRLFQALASQEKTFCEVPGGGHDALWSQGEVPHQCLQRFLSMLEAR